MTASHSSDHLLLVELNDWQISVRNAQGATLASESAAAALTNHGLVFGAAALTSARSEPQRFNNRYLTSVNADPLGNDMGAAKNSADLLYHHLRGLQLPDDPALVAVPGHYSNEQLGLLLGIMNEAAVNVCGFVDIPLGHALNLALPTTYQVLDVEWHRFSLSELTHVDGEHRLTRTTSLEHIGGIASLIDRWMNVIADDFIKKTRFDPLHNGATEQMVYDQVASWLDQRSLSDQRITITQSGTVREHEVSAGLLRSRLAEQLAQLDLGSKSDALVLTHRLANIPGAMDCFAEQGYTLLESTSENVLKNYRALAGGIHDEGITRITSAASQAKKRSTRTPNNASTMERADTSRDPTAADQAAGATLQAQAATHLLLQHHAFSIGDPRFGEYFDQAGTITHADAVLNGKPAIGAQPQPGDEVRVDGRRYIAIRIE